MYNHLKFSHKKATQVLNYFAIREGGKINKMKALKLTFLADRYHLRKYGRPITNDEYFAMEFGPVASGVKDIAEKTIVLDQKVKDYSSRFLDLKRYDLISKNSLEKDVFSDTDVEALDYVWNKFGSMDEFKLSRVTHQYPEWKKHEATLKTASRVRMNLEDFLDDPELENIDRCYSLTKDEKIDRKEQLEELNYLESLWS
ncbi:MAG: Panacea domain-containing protein [Candidatus Hodarchaeota archaeon]